MATPRKIEIVEEFTDKFKKAKSVYLADFAGLDVATVTEIRKKFREAGVEYKVVKNRLAKISLNNAGISGLDPYLNGVTGFVIGYDDPTLPAKLLKDFNKKKELLKLKVVLFEGRVFDAAQADVIANLPSREVLIAQFASTLQAPMSKLVGLLQANMQKLVGTINSVKDKKQG